MNTKNTRIIYWTGLVLVSLALLTGCASRVTRHNSTSTVDFLYPDQKDRVEVAAIPHLRLPLQVGIAFVPDKNHPAGFTEQQKTGLLEQVALHFKQHDFVRDVEIIPSVYLKPGGSFTNLEQLKSMYGIDVMALVAYDQTQFTDQDVTSLSYWTLVGAYIVPGEKNDTHTMIDAVVYDLQSRKLLFRAPGISHIKGRSTPINLSEQLRDDSLKGYQKASENLIQNLDAQLVSFKQRVKERPQEYQITSRPGYTGAGSVDSLFLWSIAGLLLTGLLSARKHSL